MKKGKVIDQMALEVLARGFNLVDNPQLIQVTTIKERFIDQMPFFNAGEMEVIGKAQFEIIGRHVETQKIGKCHWTDFAIWLREKKIKEGMEYKEAYQLVEDIMNRIPQIFRA